MAKLFVTADEVIKKEENTACDQQHENACDKGKCICLGAPVQDETRKEHQSCHETGISQNNNHDPAKNLLKSYLETGGLAVLTAFTGFYGAGGFILSYFVFFIIFQYLLTGRLEQPSKIISLCRWATLAQAGLVIGMIALPAVETLIVIIIAVSGAVMRAMSDSLARYDARKCSAKKELHKIISVKTQPGKNRHDVLNSVSDTLVLVEAAVARNR